MRWSPEGVGYGTMVRDFPEKWEASLVEVSCFWQLSRMERSSVADTASPEYPEVAQAFHIANFVPANWGAQDPISRTLVGFQHGREPETTQWIRLILQGTAGLPSAGVIVRALAAGETVPASGTPLDRLGRELAARLGSAYEPHRLSKSRPTRPVKNAGVREARDRILKDVYRFDGEGVAHAAAILIIDDCVTTGATFGAIASAIRREVPSARIRYLALGRTDPWLVRLHLGEEYTASAEAYRESLVGNAHLDERYFTGNSPTAERRRPRAGLMPRRARQADLTLAPPSGGQLRVFGEEETGEVGSPPRDPGEERGSPGNLPPAAAPAPRPGAGVPARAILTGAGVVLLLVIAFLLTRPLPAPEERRSVPPAPEPSGFVPPPAQPAGQERPRPRADLRPRGTINVPSLGLRSEPSITAPSIDSVLVMEGERVILLRTTRGEVGPEWVLIETARGVRGWVIAPAVTRVR
jgi:hypothetical protein